jgi:hypothetical protein
MLTSRESKKVAAPHIRQEEATKYRCKECSKLFKAPEFVVKHVIVKHPELIGDKLDEVSRIARQSDRTELISDRYAQQLCP